jgi:gliding motility-associated-like protein
VSSGSLTADFTPDQLSGFAPLTVNFTNNSSSTNGNAGINSVWNFGNSNSVTYSTVATASNIYTQPGSYTVTLFATKGSCYASKQKVIQVELPSEMEIPNVFTPNGDGTNDFFFIKATNLVEITAVIFDRWGNKVYEVTSETGNIEWDGKNMQGKDAAEGVYFYTMKALSKDDKEYDKKGTINLYR